MSYNREPYFLLTLPIGIAPGWTSFLYILDGALHVGPPSAGEAVSDTPGASPLPHRSFHTLVLSAGADESGVLLRSSARVEAILVAGEPLQQEVVQHGPFVMTSTEEIRRALADCERSEMFAGRTRVLMGLCRSDGIERVREGKNVEKQDRRALTLEFCKQQCVLLLQNIDAW